MEPADRAAALNIIHNFGQMPKQVTVVDVLDCVHVCVLQYMRWVHMDGVWQCLRVVMQLSESMCCVVSSEG